MTSLVGAAAPVSVVARGWGWRHATRLAWALSDVTFTVEPGERVLLLGASGSGKSTLLHALAGVLGGDDEGESAGELLVGGADPRAARGRVGLVLQDPDSQVMLARVGDDVAFGCENLGVPRDETWRRVAGSLEAVGLDLPLDHPTSELSGGQKQRLALAGVLAMRPGLLLFDEPTANLDPDGVEQVRDSVARVAASTGSTLIVVEHRVSVWRDLVDRIIVLGARGSVLADGSPDAVLGERGAELAASGIWVPGHPPAAPTRTLGATTAVIEARDLSVARAPQRVVASSIDLSVSSGRVLAITGPNGAGKSTLGLTLGGLIPAAAGTVDATPLATGTETNPFRWKSRDLLTRVGTVFQDPEHQFLARTVKDELLVGPRVLGRSEAELEEVCAELASRLRLDRLLGANPFTLSGGEKRRLSVATALATRPRVLILDEPTFGQDSRTWEELVALLAELADAGSAVVTITHDTELVEALADSEFRMPGAA
ncbi:energy-coupling factor transport system ATP-binding protein [Leifsonia sp. AK011]|uniref:ABC transporter ATP-binding protein n=1 Tax=Leifsonia sp. AK011 TaxID=2723075 RepID=UPI001806103B|nr:ATP-binding cassette domain-containing protein [Leifsonia sp. AK011]NYF11113.1 energy-coupling factor transport system ATP-binding protein [Leifsonia sp. AK011]